MLLYQKYVCSICEIIQQNNQISDYLYLTAITTEVILSCLLVTS